MQYFIVQTDDFNRNQLLVRYSNIVVPIGNMLFRYNWAIFSPILEPINNNKNTLFSGLIFPIFNAFQEISSNFIQSVDRHNSTIKSTRIPNRL